MTGFRVNTGYLRGLAGQIEANRDNAVDYAAGYTAQHCRNYDRISGLMEPVQWFAEVMTGLWVDNLYPQQGHMLTGTADGLRRAADSYDNIDQSTAGRLIAFAPMGESGAGGGASSEGAVAGPFTHGADVSLNAPKDEHLTGDVQERIEAIVGDITDVIKRFTGWDIVAEWTPIILGDWGALRRLADAWGQVAKALGAVEDDLEAGLGILMPQWQGGESDANGGAPAFEAHMRDRVILSYTLFRQLADLNREGFESAAINYEALVTNGLWYLEFKSVAFKAVGKKIVKALQEVTLNPKTWYDLIDELVSIVGDYIDFLKNSITAFEICVEQLIQLVELITAEAKAVGTFVEWKIKNG